MSAGKIDAATRARMDAELAVDRALSMIAVAEGLICDLSLPGANAELRREIENLAAVVAAGGVFVEKVREWFSVEG